MCRERFRALLRRLRESVETLDSDWKKLWLLGQERIPPRNGRRGRVQFALTAAINAFSDAFASPNNIRVLSL